MRAGELWGGPHVRAPLRTQTTSSSPPAVTEVSGVLVSHHFLQFQTGFLGSRESS